MNDNNDDDNPPKPKRMPPVWGRFQKGQSGNKNGRPKKRPDDLSAAVKSVLAKKVTVVENGKRRKISLWEATMHRLGAGAANGDIKTVLALLKVMTTKTAQEPTAPLNEQPLSAAEKEIVSDIMERAGYDVSKDFFE